MPDPRSSGDPNNRPSDEAQLSARLKRLGERLGRQPSPQQDHEPSTQTPADRTAMARGLRLSSELVAGVLVGAFIGWLVDRWLGISPWGLIVFFLLGFAAGIVNVIRAAGIGPDRERSGGRG